MCVCVLTILTWQDGSLFRTFVPGSCIPPSAAGVHSPDTTAAKQAYSLANNTSIKECQTAEAKTKRQMADRRRSRSFLLRPRHPGHRSLVWFHIPHPLFLIHPPAVTIFIPPALCPSHVTSGGWQWKNFTTPVNVPVSKINSC